MIDEIKEQLHGNVPDAIVVAVGGGGLLCGICQGLHQVGWGHVPVVAMETVGCDSLNHCVREKQWAQLSDITRLPCVYAYIVNYYLCLFVCVYMVQLRGNVALTRLHSLAATRMLANKARTMHKVYFNIFKQYELSNRIDRLISLDVLDFYHRLYSGYI